MDPACPFAFATLAGSTIGALTPLGASWLNPWGLWRVKCLTFSWT
jgi:hypothetical protein